MHLRKQFLVLRRDGVDRDDGCCTAALPDACRRDDHRGPGTDAPPPSETSIDAPSHRRNSRRCHRYDATNTLTLVEAGKARRTPVSGRRRTASAPPPSSDRPLVFTEASPPSLQ